MALKLPEFEVQLLTASVTLARLLSLICKMVVVSLALNEITLYKYLLKCLAHSKCTKMVAALLSPSTFMSTAHQQGQGLMHLSPLPLSHTQHKAEPTGLWKC